MSLQSLQVRQIKTAFDRSLTLLKRDLKENAEKAGWHQYVGGERIGNVATAQALLVHNYLKTSSRLVDKTLLTLRETQRQDEGSFDYGGWTYLTSGAVCVVEATAWSLSGLFAGGERFQSDVFARGISWIKRNQNADGGWGPRRGITSRTYTTFLACKAISLLDPLSIAAHTNLYSHVRRWLIDCRNMDGGWGDTVGNASSSVHTAFALLIMSTLEEDQNTELVEGGISYLYSQWNKTTMWERTQNSEQYELADNTTDPFTRISINHFPTPWVIVALLTNGQALFQDQIFSSIKWLIQQQNVDGSWAVSGVARNRIWAVHDAILAIKLFMEKAIVTHTVAHVVLVGNSILLTRTGLWNNLSSVLLIGLTVTLFIGVIVGILFSSATGIATYLGPWVRLYWAWGMLGIYLISICPLLLFKVISTKEALIGMVIPAILLLIQVFL